jgi:hypothetical protein
VTSFHTFRSHLFKGIGWGFGFYSLDTSVQVIIVSNLIINLNLVFLEMIDLTVNFWIFISTKFASILVLTKRLRKKIQKEKKSLATLN